MALAHLTTVCLGVLCTLLPFTTGSCNLPGYASVEAEINKLLDAMPKEKENAIFSGNVFPGLSVDGMKVRGFDQLELYGPIQIFCKNVVSASGHSTSLSIAQADFITTRAFGLSVPWKTCAGSSGTIHLTAGLTRFTLQFLVEPAHPDSRDALKLTVARHIKPVAVEDVDLYITEDVGFLRAVGYVAGKLFNSQLRELILEVLDGQITPVFEQDRGIAMNEVEH